MDEAYRIPMVIWWVLMIIFILETAMGAYKLSLIFEIFIVVLEIIFAIIFILFIARWVAQVYETNKILGVILYLVISGIFIVLDLIGFMLYLTYNTIGAINSMFHYIYPVYK
jgi:hypothetical protein